MKIYVQNLNDSTIEYSNIIQKDIVYTPYGILHFKQKKWRKENIVHEKYESLNYGGYDLLLEYNVYDYNEIYTHIPYEHILVNETYKEYPVDYNLVFVMHTYLNETSYYFETKQFDDDILNKIISFLLNK